MKNHNLPSVWFNGVDKEKKTEFEGAIRNSTIALSRLYDILDQYIVTLENEEQSEEMYNKPEVPFRQAYINGQKRSLNKIMYLIEGVARPNG